MNHSENEEDHGTPALASLQAEADPPAGLEDRLAARLRAEGLLGRGRWGGVGLAPAAAVAVLCLGLGWALGRRAPLVTPTPATTAAADDRGSYLLLLYEDPGFETAPDDMPDRVAEYSAWAGGLAAAGSLVSAEKLRDDGITFVGATKRRGPSSTGDPGGLLGGFFLVRAASDAEAERIARDCPHLRHGGRVVVRSIEPTPRT